MAPVHSSLIIAAESSMSLLDTYMQFVYILRSTVVMVCFIYIFNTGFWSWKLQGSIWGYWGWSAWQRKSVDVQTLGQFIWVTIILSPITLWTVVYILVLPAGGGTISFQVTSIFLDSFTRKKKKKYHTKLYLLWTVNTLSLLSIIGIIRPTLAYLLPFLYNLSPNAYVNVLWQLNTECQTSGTPHWPNKFRFIQDILC